jgi:hypothetical protein
MQNEGTSLMTIHVGRAGFAGLSLVYGLTLSGTLVFFIQYVCQLANDIVSVERICQYMDIPSEAPAIIKDHRPPTNWPLEGKIDLQNLQVIFVQLKFAVCLFVCLLSAYPLLVPVLILMCVIVIWKLQIFLCQFNVVGF